MYEITYKGKKYTAKKFAEKVKVSPATICTWIKNKRDDLFIKNIGLIPQVKIVGNHKRTPREEKRSDKPKKICSL